MCKICPYSIGHALSACYLTQNKSGDDSFDGGPLTRCNVFIAELGRPLGSAAAAVFM
jgi:hypothetical protein